MIWVPTINAYVNSSDFLLASEVERSAPSVGCIKQILPHNQICVTWWWTNDELASSFTDVEALPSLISVTHQNLQLRCTREVTERILSVSAIGTGNLKDIACAGMVKVFFMRYQVSIQ